MITYIDRAFWGSAQKNIKTELGLRSVADLAVALWAFQPGLYSSKFRRVISATAMDRARR